MDDDRTALMSDQPLPAGYEIHIYTLEEVLGQGGFGITYRAHDKSLNRKVAVKEYLPSPYAYRHQNSSVKPLTGNHKDTFDWGLKSFLEEAQTLAQFNHPNIVKVHYVHQQNNTAYMVMEYEEGDSLSAIYKQPPTTQGFYEGIFFPIISGLQLIHDVGFIHRDIKPANIYIRKDRTPVLIDFGAARLVAQQDSGELTVMGTRHYSPVEQFSTTWEQGPWTDIYALAATMYQGIVGEKPESSQERSNCLAESMRDPVQRLLAADYPGFTQTFLDAMVAGLEFNPQKRPQSLGEWKNLFLGEESSVSTKVAPNKISTTDDDSDFGFDDVRFDSSSTGNDFARPADPNFTVERRSAKKPRNGKQVKSTGGRQLAFGAVAGIAILAAAGLGFYMLSDGEPDPPVINTKFLEDLPRPPGSMDIALPQEVVLQQIDDMLIMSDSLKKAHALNPDDPRVQEVASRVVSELEQHAVVWNASNHQEIAKKIQRVAVQLREVSGRSQNIASLLSQSDQRSDYDKVLSLVKSGEVVTPEGNSVLDFASRLSGSDFERIRKTEPWTSMMVGFHAEVVKKLKASDFDGAARIVEAALSIDQRDPQMNLVRAHLRN